LIVITVFSVVAFLVFIYMPMYSPYVYGVRHSEEIVSGGIQLMDLIPEGGTGETVKQWDSGDARIPASLQKMDATFLVVSHDEVIFLAWRSIFYVYRGPPPKEEVPGWRITDQLYWSRPK
jgi:hypothetical protein